MSALRPLAPFHNSRSRVLILGSFPSVKSRESGFYYANERNRFWAVLAAVYGRAVPATLEQKKALLLDCRIALWDVIERCDIVGSSDSSIKNAQPADISALLSGSEISRIFLNGATAARLYARFSAAHIALPAVALPSTSPANAAYSLERLVEHWRVLRE